MSSAARWALRALHAAMLRTAGQLVPHSQRAEWLREWRSELWHVERGPVQQSQMQAAGQSQQNDRAITAFCLGAFNDALCLRRESYPPAEPITAKAGTPARCLLVLGAILTTACAAAILLPGVRAERDLGPHRVNTHLILIQLTQADFGLPTIPFKRFEIWRSHRHLCFDGFAFYTADSKPVERTTPTSQLKTSWRIGHTDTHMFPLLGLPVRFAARPTANGAPQLILSEQAWKQQFRADSHISGTFVQVNGRPVRIAGIVADSSLELPGRIDAWEIDSDRAIATSSLGYVVAHLTPDGIEAMWTERLPIGAGDAEDDLVGLSIQQSRSPLAFYAFALALAVLALPAITSVSLGESGVNPHKSSWPARLNRWGFFTAKLALLLPIVYFLSLDLAYGIPAIGRDPAIYLQLAATFGLCLFGLRWALKDQRQRCPVCMRTVTHPAQVGLASRTFLDWNGTEMMCAGGHTLLHVPSLPTSWFGAQRWLYLDTSWQFLFAAPTPPAA